MNKTVLVTGGTGYIGSWVVKGLLENGYTVRLTVRDKKKTSKFLHLQEIAQNKPGMLEIHEADLLLPQSFDDASSGCDAIIHLASPFTLRFKDPKRDLLDPALLGTRNVLDAASRSDTVKKVVLTSSVAAIYGDNADLHEQGLIEFTEEHFNYSSSLHHQPYSYSKVCAEKEAWRIHNNQDKWKLVVINPSFVMGPSLSKHSDSESLVFMKGILKGKYQTGAPDLLFGFVDVRDVAQAHLIALESSDAEGRFIISAITAGMTDLAAIIKKLYGKKFKLPAMKAPKFILYLTGWMFGVTLKYVSRNVGHPLKFNNNKSIRVLGMTYTPFEITVKDMVDQMLAMNMVN